MAVNTCASFKSPLSSSAFSSGSNAASTFSAVAGVSCVSSCTMCRSSAASGPRNAGALDGCARRSARNVSRSSTVNKHAFSRLAGASSVRNLTRLILGSRDAAAVVKPLGQMHSSTRSFRKPTLGLTPKRTTRRHPCASKKEYLAVRVVADPYDVAEPRDDASMRYESDSPRHVLSHRRSVYLVKWCLVLQAGEAGGGQ